MEKEYLKIYLAGEIHTDWRDIIKKKLLIKNLELTYYLR